MSRLRIFLCYRRDDTRWVAGRLYDELSQRYGPEQVFQDITAILPGIRYTDQIQEEIGRCDVLVVVMGEGWLSAADPQGRRRLDSPRDLVRLEIAAALQRGIPIIPVLVQRASMPADVELPDDIADLTLYHACEVTDTRWHYDVGVLLKAIDGLAEESVPAETSAVGGQAGPIRRQQARGGKAEYYRAFWTRFLERVHAEHPDWTTARIPQKDNWITMPSGIKGAVYGHNFAAGGRLRAELYIDSGDAEINLKLFRALKTRAQAIEAAYGKALSWEELPGRRACRIADYASGDVANTDQHDVYIDWFFDTSIRLREALARSADQGLGRQPSLAPLPRARMADKVRVFISFDPDYDLDLKNALVGQSRLPDPPFNITDWSIKDPPSEWKEKARQRIRQVDQVAVICGEHTDTAKGVNEEIRIARDEEKPYFLLEGRADKACRKPKAALRSDKMYNWTWENLKRLIAGAR